ncbi:RNA polymerase sigma factor [Phreatobacter stygius]|uniref:RNA polymerase sigma factor n=1 Tax=Phreatobacter stygius TaxID=1940610 RepID=A0A4D7AYS3_9HYPH|nr:RNA polymerase sigma factor [Phreatobacter stygius]QCI64545.1 RNA polymerase sigma factor [Phreatobacter stygius]
MTTVSTDVVRGTADLDALFRTYHQDLTRFARARLRDREAAADVVQDTFLRYLAHQTTGDHSLSPVSSRFFLWRIASNLIIDMVRRDRRRGAFASIDGLAHELVDPAPAADRRLMAREEFRAIKQALDELPPKARAALLLSRVEGLSHAEIADRLGVSASMVTKYIMTALRHCLKRMAVLDL